MRNSKQIAKTVKDIQQRPTRSDSADKATGLDIVKRAAEEAAADNKFKMMMKLDAKNEKRRRTGILVNQKQVQAFQTNRNFTPAITPELERANENSAQIRTVLSVPQAWAKTNTDFKSRQ